VSTAADGKKPVRPRQVTIAGVMAAIACGLLVLTLFDAMSQVRSTDTQAAVRDFLGKPPGSSLGIGVDGVVDLLRGIVLLSGGLAAAGAVLAVYCLRRHRGARIGLSLVAVAMLFSTTFVAGLLPFVVALAASMLWRREARDWFDGREPRPAGAPAGAPAPAQAAQPYAQSYAPPYPTVQHPGTPYPMVQQPVGERRPGSVMAAALVTWVCAGFTTFVLLLLVLVLLVQEGELLTALQDNPEVASQGYTHDQLVGALWVIAVLGIAWSLVASVLAALAVRRVQAARLALVVSAVLSGLLGVGTVVLPLAAVATVVLLLRPEVNRWFSRR
jgi:hypothetical protein